MRRPTLLATALIGLLTLLGCYETAIELAPVEQAKVEKAYLGTWSFTWKDDDSLKGATATVLNLDGKQYFVEWAEFPPDGKRDVTRYRAIIVPVQGASFAQLSPITDELPDKHVIMRAELKDGKLRLRNLNQKFFEGVTTIEQLRQQLSHNLEDERMYEGEWIAGSNNIATTRP